MWGIKASAQKENRASSDKRIQVPTVKGSRSTRARCMSWVIDFFFLSEIVQMH
jgi:hypothetical protein